MSTQVAGVLKDPFERPLANTDIDIRAITNTFAVLPGATIKVTTNSQGEYNFILEPANYAVSVIMDGRAVYQGAISITSTTPPGTLPELLKQAEMLSELPINYAEYFQQVQATVKSDADRAQAAADGIDDQVDEAREYAEQSQASAQSSQQSSQTAQQALADTQVIADKFQNLDEAVTETQQNAQQTQSDAAQTSADRAAADAAAQRAEDAAGSAETVNIRNLRVPTTETINAFPNAAGRANSLASFDASGQSTVTPLSKIAVLDSGGKVPISNIPAAAITEVFPVSSQSQMLALTADPGDVAKRTDQGRSYILMSSPASTLANWVVITDDVLLQLSSPDGYRYIGAVNSFADLRTLTPASNGVMVNLRGWRAGSNIGGGLFVGMLSSATDDGGIIASSGGSFHWRRVMGSVIGVEHFGAAGDGLTDDSDAFQRAFDSGIRCIRIPSVPDCYVIKKQLNITKGIDIRGDGVTPYIALGSPNTRGTGSWLLFDHPGKGIFVNNANSGFAGCGLYSFGTFRKHPTPGAGAFTPNVYDWDIEVNNTVDVNVIDMCLLNPYKGITSYGSQTRMTVDRLIGHPLKQGMVIQEAFDIHRINNVHFWCFWAQNQQVWNYTLANLDAFTLGRCDNHMYMNVFSIFHFRGLLILNSTNGTANKLKLANVDLDRGYHGYVVDSAAVGHTAQISNMTIQGETGVTGENFGIAIYANQCDLSFSNLDIRNLNNNAIYAAGTFTNIGISELYCSDWSKTHVTDPAINLIQSNSVAFINGCKRFYSTVGNNSARYGGAGKVRTMIDRGTFSGTTSSTGDITITFGGNAIPNMFSITNLNGAPLSFCIIARTLSSVTVRVFSGTTALTSTAIALGWEASL